MQRISTNFNLRMEPALRAAIVAAAAEDERKPSDFIRHELRRVLRLRQSSIGEAAVDGIASVTIGRGSPHGA